MTKSREGSKIRQHELKLLSAHQKLLNMAGRSDFHDADSVEGNIILSSDKIILLVAEGKHLKAKDRLLTNPTRNAPSLPSPEAALRAVDHLIGYMGKVLAATHDPRHTKNLTAELQALKQHRVAWSKIIEDKKRDTPLQAYFLLSSPHMSKDMADEEMAG